MSRVVVFGRSAVLPGAELSNESIRVEIENGVIQSVERIENFEGKREAFDEKSEGELMADLISPGGADDAVSFWCNPDFTLSRLPCLGTTSCLASIVFPSSKQESSVSEETRDVLESLSLAMERPSNGAVLEGVHAEGPVVNDCGALPGARPDMSLTDFQQLIKIIPKLKIMTISPHLESQCDYIRLKALLEHDILPSLGHDKVASETEILGALRICRSRRLHITHCFNVSTFHHRNPSLVNFGLMNCFPNLPQYRGILSPTVEVIADMAHVHPLTLQVMLQARHYSDIAIVSDAIHEPIPGKRLKYMGRELEVSDDGSRVSMVGSGVLAGSCSSLLQAFRTLVNVFGLPIGQAIAMLSETPARIAGLHHIGSISVGKRADLLLFDSHLNLQKALVNGQIVYDSKPLH